jgi:polyferredoxin
MEKIKSQNFIRHAVQIVAFLLIALVALSKYLAATGSGLLNFFNVSLHAICPFGGVVSIYEMITTGGLVHKVQDSSWILMILVFASAVLFGAVFCGYICPFGSIQEWVGKLGKRLFPHRYNRFIPGKIDGVLRYLRYVVLALVVYQTAASVKLVFQDYNPYFALFNFFTNEVAVSAYAILGITLVLSLFIERPWCKYACPYGAVLGLFNTFRIFKIRRKEETCIHCGLCDKTCPMNIEISQTKTVSNHQCISCYQCTSDDTCPVSDTVIIALGKGGTKNEN